MEKRDWLKYKRLENNLTQSKVAKASGVERSYYTMIELGERRPSVQVAKSIARVLDFDWTIFFSDESNETKHFLNDMKENVAI